MTNTTQSERTCAGHATIDPYHAKALLNRRVVFRTYWSCRMMIHRKPRLRKLVVNYFSRKYPAEITLINWLKEKK